MIGMKTYWNNIFFILLMALLFSGCTENPVDEDGLLITDREECYVSNFDLLGTDRLSVRVGNAEIDNSDCTIKEPKITGITDFSDLENPKQYTVISGNRQVRKTYTVYISVQPLK